MLNFKKRKTAALLAFVSMLCNSSISKALEVTKNPGVTKTLAAEKIAGSNSKMKIVIDWVKDHKVLTGGIGALFLGGLVTASVFLAKHIKNKNKIENNGDKDNLNGELNALNNENNGEKNNEKNDNEFSESENDTNISNNNEENNENNVNNEKNENIQIENKKENIINLNTNMENDNNKNIIIINKKPEENKINYENTQTKNLNIEGKNKNIINLENNDKNKNIMINNGNVDSKVNKNTNKSFNNNFKINCPNNINLLHYKSVMSSFDKLRQKILKIKLDNSFKSLINCFSNNCKLQNIDFQKNSDVQNLKSSYYICIKINKINYRINFEMLGNAVDETKVTIENMDKKSKKTLNIQ